ncbi:MAG TPA: hypothetical protein PLS10_06965 [Chitinophagales bacterium]|nr:hypothetical protein [Chitinophagales bacterium]
MIVIYTPKVTNRIKYTADFIFSHYFGITYEFTENPAVTVSPENFYINYSKQKLANFFSIFQDDLLLEENVKAQKIFVSREAEMPVFFQTTEHFDLKFDIFSCIFYLLSRYEEYLPHDKDVHGRYKSSNSILAKPEFNFSPVVEIWLSYFKEALLKIHSKLVFKNHQFEYVPTFDVDNAFKYLGRNWKKHPPNFLNSDGIKTLIGNKKDEYDIFDNILNELMQYNLNPVFFFLLSDDGDNNSNVSPYSKKYRALINRLSSLYTTGIHPSYCSFEKNLIQSEKKELQNLSKTITVSRQHFLKINFPDYFRRLHESGVEIDYSLSYPDVVGFRAGFSREFYFFDIINNMSLPLLIQPSCWMDATYEYYQPKKNIEIQQNFLTLFNQLKQINGKLVAIFHNDLLAKQIYWGVFEFINQQTNLGDEK